jgi:hypothetical protein
MRKAKWIVGAVLAFSFAGLAAAQQFQSALTGVRPSDVQFRKIDTSGAIASPSLTSMGQSRFSLSSFFRRLNPFAPSTPARIVVPRQQYPSAFDPLPPINSTINRR